MKLNHLFLLAILSLSAHAQAADVTANVKSGTQVVFTSTVGDGTAPFTYQWHKNNVFIAGATAANYTITAISPVDAGTYFVQVKNAYGVTVSNNAVITVTITGTAPGNIVIRVSYTPAT